ncbi:MAG TPA: alpha/beta fold hydrolase [Flavobacteriaceae bacterium]|nr:alpha/beta fold hydrolase [Flavobacteriaceae bacterium]
MSLFRINPNEPFQGPHQHISPVEYGAPPTRAKAAMLMVHGRGATARGIIALADEFAQPDFFYTAPQAQGHTWYPYSFLAPKEKNQPGISSGLQAIYDLLESIIKSGIPREKIILLGFSQGACLASEFLARHPQKLGGLVAFSGGLIGPEINQKDYSGEMHHTPVFLGCSDIDSHIPKERVDETESIFQKLGAVVDKRIYKGMAHTINEDEIKAVRAMMAKLVQD